MNIKVNTKAQVPARYRHRARKTAWAILTPYGWSSLRWTGWTQREAIGAFLGECAAVNGVCHPWSYFKKRGDAWLVKLDVREGEMSSRTRREQFPRQGWILESGQDLRRRVMCIHGSEEGPKRDLSLSMTREEFSRWIETGRVPYKKLFSRLDARIVPLILSVAA